MEWKTEFLPQEGYWLRKSPNEEELVWLHAVNGIWCAVCKSGFQGFRVENGYVIADEGTKFKGPYIF